jgi:uncharacterized protein (DUF697 family)
MTTKNKPWLARRIQTALSRGLMDAYHAMQVDADDYLLQLQHGHALSIRSYKEIFSVPQQVIDGVAEQTIASSMKLAAIEGAGFGFFGFGAVIPDMAVLATIAAQMIQKLSLIYGFEIATERERAELWLAAASAFGIDFGKDVLEKEVLERVVPRVILRLSGKISGEMAEKIAGKIIPIVSAAIGGAINYWFIKQWGRRVQSHFREKHIALRSQLLLVPAAPLGSKPDHFLSGSSFSESEFMQ